MFYTEYYDVIGGGYAGAETVMARAFKMPLISI